MVKEDDRFYFKDGNLTWLREWKDIAIPKYVFYWLKSPIGQSSFYQQLIGSSQKALTISSLKSIKISVPKDKSIQRRIASILSAYDDLIENNLQRIKLLEEKAFTKYKIFVASEKTETRKVGDLATVRSGYAFKSRDWTEQGFPVIKIKNINNNDIILDGCSYISDETANLASNFELSEGNLLIAMTGATVGKIGMMPKTDIPFYLNQRVGLFTPKFDTAELYLFCFFNETIAQDTINNIASGAAQPNISASQIEGITLQIPKLELVKEFGYSLKSTFELIRLFRYQNSFLAEARDILLPRLMNQQIEV